MQFRLFNSVALSLMLSFDAGYQNINKLLIFMLIYSNREVMYTSLKVIYNNNYYYVAPLITRYVETDNYTVT